LNAQEFARERRFAETPFGRIAYVERGQGPVALFFHGAFLNGFQWRDVIEGCAGRRRCIAFDAMGHGHTEIAPDQAVDFTAQAEMAAAFLDGLGIDRVDVVGNDSGGGIAQVFTARWPERVSSLALTNCDVFTCSPPPGFERTRQAFRAGRAAAVCRKLLGDLDYARSPAGFGLTFEQPERLDATTLETYLGPLVATPERTANFARFVLSLEPRHTEEIADGLRQVTAPTLLAWGTADTFFDKKWAYWLAGAIPGSRPVVELDGARLFWPEERPAALGDLLRDLWGPG
jgi:pimeloyl-ACP methyl ester carboxylesterase